MAKTKTSSKKSAKTAKTAPASKSRKQHRGVKVFVIVLLILVIITGGIAAWFFAYYNNPEKVALDAVEQLFSSENVGFEGGLSLFLNDEAAKDSEIKGALFSIESASDQLPTSSTAKFQLLFNPEKVQGEPKVLVTLKNVVMKNGVIYFQIAGLMDSLNSFSFSLSEWSAIEDYLPMIESIDNEWWQIDVNHILSELELLASQRNAISQVYSCVVEAMNQNSSAEMSQIYKQHRFINVTPAKHLAPEDDIDYPETASWHNAYEVTINRTELANYINAIPETAAANDFYACFNAVEEQYGTVPLSIGASDFDEISADDIDLPDDLRIFIEVSTFGHKLRSIYVYQDTDEYMFGGSFLMNYQTVTVSAPNSYRPISDLFEELFELIGQNIPSYEEE